MYAGNPENIINYYVKLTSEYKSSDITDSVRKILTRSAKRINEIFKIKEYCNINTSRRFRKEALGRYHLGGSSRQTYMLNQFMISPLVDYDIFKWKIGRH